MRKFQKNVRAYEPKAGGGDMPLAPVVGSAAAAALTVFIFGAAWINGHAAAAKPAPLMFALPWGLGIAADDARAPSPTSR